MLGGGEKNALIEQVCTAGARIFKKRFRTQKFSYVIILLYSTLYL
jgi:hypothetical protein